MLTNVASYVASYYDGSDGTNGPDVAVAPAAPAPPDNTPPGDTKRSPIPHGYGSVADPNAAPEPIPTGWGSGSARSHVTGVREWATEPNVRQRQKPKPVSDNGLWRKRKSIGDQPETVNNVRKGFRHWMKTAICWVDCLDANRSSKAEFKEASDYLIEGYRRMYALDEEHIIIKRDHLTGEEILHHMTEEQIKRNAELRLEENAPVIDAWTPAWQIWSHNTGL